jgi:hypothetical protein
MGLYQHSSAIAPTCAVNGLVLSPADDSSGLYLQQPQNCHPRLDGIELSLVTVNDKSRQEFHRECRILG